MKHENKSSRFKIACFIAIASQVALAYFTYVGIIDYNLAIILLSVVISCMLLVINSQEFAKQKEIPKPQPKCELEQNINEYTSVESLEKELKFVFQKWQSIGSPPHIKRDFNLINFFMSIKAWKSYDENAYNLCVASVDDLIEACFNQRPRSTRISLREKALESLQYYYSMKNYLFIRQRLQSLTLAYI
jgi:hypothetical protein